MPWQYGYFFVIGMVLIAAILGWFGWIIDLAIGS